MSTLRMTDKGTPRYDCILELTGLSGNVLNTSQISSQSMYLLALPSYVWTALELTVKSKYQCDHVPVYRAADC